MKTRLNRAVVLTIADLKKYLLYGLMGLYFLTTFIYGVTSTALKTVYAIVAGIVKFAFEAGEELISALS